MKKQGRETAPAFRLFKKLYQRRIKKRKGTGNKEFPVWNPQVGLCSTEENRAFYVNGTHLFIPLFTQKRLE